jgi:UDP-N-acetylglucosamine 3-dehydrogenase
MNVAVIGMGNMGIHHARIYNEMKNVNLVSLSDIDEKKGNKYAKKYKCKFYKNYKEMLKNEKINAVSICVPTSLHKEVALNVAKRDIDIIIEKPIAESELSALEIINAIQKRDLILMVGHIERFNPAIIKLKKILDSGKLGEIISLNIKRVGIFPPRIKDSNVIIDLAIHDIDISNYLLDSYPDTVFARGGSALLNEREDYAEIFLVYKNTNVLIQVNWITPVKIRNLTITGKRGYVELDYITQDLYIYENNIYKEYNDFGDFIIKFGKPKKIKQRVEKAEPLKLELEHFIDCVKNRKKPKISGYEALNALKIAKKVIDKIK